MNFSLFSMIYKKEMIYKIKIRWYIKGKEGGVFLCDKERKSSCLNELETCSKFV